MTELPTTTNAESGHDISLVSWFASLSPEQRLAELESRVAFFHSLRDEYRDEYLAPLNMSVNALAKALRVDATRMHQIVRERRRITPETAERPARYFSTAPQFWMNLQIQYDLKEFEASEEAAEIARDVQPRKGATA